MKTFKTSKFLEGFFRLFFLVAAGRIFGRDWRETARWGMTDLRNRVVGCRAAGLDKDPYTYHWGPGDSERLLDPSDHHLLPVSRVTVTPATLALHAPIAGLRYPAIRRIWSLSQWGAALFCHRLILKAVAEPGDRTALRLLHIFFLFSPGWRMHMAVGQVTLHQAALASVVVLHAGENPRLAAALAGFLAMLRPYYGTLPIPFLARGHLFETGAGLAAGCLLPGGLGGGWRLWRSYFKSLWAHCTAIRWRLLAAEPRLFERPQTIEGMLAADLDRLPPAVISNFRRWYTQMTGRFLPAGKEFLIVLPLIAGFLACSVVSVARGEPLRRGVGLALLASVAGEVFGPVARYAYCDFIFHPLVCAVLLNRQTGGARTVLLLTGTATGLLLQKPVTGKWANRFIREGQGLASVLVLGGVCVWAVWKLLVPANSKTRE